MGVVKFSSLSNCVLQQGKIIIDDAPVIFPTAVAAFKKITGTAKHISIKIVRIVNKIQ